jgi:hypothetical protein
LKTAHQGGLRLRPPYRIAFDRDDTVMNRQRIIDELVREYRRTHRMDPVGIEYEDLVRPAYVDPKFVVEHVQPVRGSLKLIKELATHANELTLISSSNESSRKATEAWLDHYEIADAFGGRIRLTGRKSQKSESLSEGEYDLIIENSFGEAQQICKARIARFVIILVAKKAATGIIAMYRSEYLYPARGYDGVREQIAYLLPDALKAA